MPSHCGLEMNKQVDLVTIASASLFVIENIPIRLNDIKNWNKIQAEFKWQDMEQFK